MEHFAVQGLSGGDAARAEFVRVQIELARLPARDRAARKLLEARERALLLAHREKWEATVPSYADERPEFRRGFVDRRRSRRSERARQGVTHARVRASDFDGAAVLAGRRGTGCNFLDHLGIERRNIVRLAAGH